MENFSRTSLATWIRENRPLNEETMRDITKQIA